jgi:SAM-dependent methyltransferase
MTDQRFARLRTSWVRSGHRQRLTRAAAPLIEALRGRILDVGGGRDAPHDAAWHPDVRRIRIDLSAVHEPELQADAARLPLSDESFDAVVMFEVLEHLSDPPAAAAEVLRVLRPRGTFLGSAPFVWPVHGDPHDYFRFSADGLRIVLHGFSQVQILPLGNAAGSAWLLLSNGSRALRILNPLLRRLGDRADPRAPEGYVFSATR